MRSVQTLFVVTLVHRDGLLGQDRAGVHPGVDQVDRASGDRHPVVQRVPDGMGARKRR